MTDPMKYYVYVSDIKVNMLFSMIPENVLKGISAELKIKLEVLGIGGEIKLKGKEKEEDTEKKRYSRLKVVVKYIEKHLKDEIGTVDIPGTYFKGVLPMHWGEPRPIQTPHRVPSPYPHGGDATIVFFGGYSTKNTIVGLGGSPSHIVGRSIDGFLVREPPPRYSTLPAITDALSEILDTSNSSSLSYPSDRKMLNEPLGRDYTLALVEEMVQSMKQMPAQNLEFLAVTLLEGPSTAKAFNFHGARALEQIWRVVLGSPIYVALASKHAINLDWHTPATTPR